MALLASVYLPPRPTPMVSVMTRRSWLRVMLLRFLKARGRKVEGAA